MLYSKSLNYDVLYIDALNNANVALVLKMEKYICFRARVFVNTMNIISPSFKFLHN